MRDSAGRNSSSQSSLNEAFKSKAIEQFVGRFTASKAVKKIDNASLMAGEPMYFYCKHCDVLIEALEEEYLFPPYSLCSQCEGLREEGWLEEAKDKVKDGK